jgi:hypothetical protein
VERVGALEGIGLRSQRKSKLMCKGRVWGWEQG